MVRCVAPGCSNDNCNESGRQLTFFSFPKDAKQRREWVVKMGRALRGKTAYFEPLKNDRLCSAHFENSCFQRDLRAEFAADGLLEAGSVRAPKRLKSGAIPTIFSHKRPPSARRESADQQQKEEEAAREKKEQVSTLPV